MSAAGAAPGRVVIVGAGESGARVAIALREQGFDGEIALIGAEPHAPYERPPLSKAAIVDAEAPLPAIGDVARFPELGVDVRLGVGVVAVDRAARHVRLADGVGLAYDKLVLATGARARALPVSGAEHALTLRTYEDALELRERFRSGARVAIVGGGFIGLELAASARKLGCDVTVIEAAPRVLQRATPPELSALVEARHRAEGVELLTGAGVEGFERDGVRLTGGGRVEASTFIVGVGAVPDIELARSAGLVIENGVRADARLRTSDPDIFACGDCVSFPHGLFDGRRLRLEAWRNAFDSGAYVARAILGADEDYLAVPWFWSDQYDACLQIAGLPDAGVATAARDLGEGALLLFHLAADGRLVGAGGWGPLGKIAREIRLAEMLIARRASPAAAALADPSVKLKSLL